ETRVPAGWRVVGLFWVGVSFIAGYGSRETIAVGLGGILLGYRAFAKLTTSLSSIAGAVIAFKRFGVLFRAATRRDPPGSAALADEARSRRDDERDPPPVLVAEDVVFGYSERSAPVLRDCRLEIRPGDRPLLVGP